MARVVGRRFNPGPPPLEKCLQELIDKEHIPELYTILFAIKKWKKDPSYQPIKHPYTTQGVTVRNPVKGMFRR